MDAILTLHLSGYAWLETLLENLLKKECDKQALAASKQIITALVENVLTLEESIVDHDDKSQKEQRLLSCLTTLYLFSKVKPELLVPHAEVMQPYLSMKCQVGKSWAFTPFLSLCHSKITISLKLKQSFHNPFISSHTYIHTSDPIGAIGAHPSRPHSGNGSSSDGPSKWIIPGTSRGRTAQAGHQTRHAGGASLCVMPLCGHQPYHIQL